VFNVAPEIREKVRYLKHDLLTCIAPEYGKSIIVCKNVLMHFTYEERIGVLSMFHDTLEPGGFLVLDGAQNIPEESLEQFSRVEPGLPLYRKTDG